MFLSFAGVILIACQGLIIKQKEDEDQFGARRIGSYPLGCLCLLTTSVCYAIVSVLTRRLQKLNYAVVLFYYGLVAFPGTALMIFIEWLFFGGSWRFNNYDQSTYLLALGMATLNMIGLASQTVAMQNERSGFITLIGYVGLVYAFFGDMFVFNSTPHAVELTGILIILVLNVTLICTKFENKKPALK